MAWQARRRSLASLAAVGALEFSRLAEGQHPATGEQLVQHRVAHEYKTDDGRTVTPAEHRAGWDGTFLCAEICFADGSRGRR